MTEDVLKKPCAFLIKMYLPLLTMVQILGFLRDRNIQVNTMHLQCFNEKEGILIIHCLIERDRVRHTKNQMKKIKGIGDLDILESRESNLIKL